MLARFAGTAQAQKVDGRGRGQCRLYTRRYPAKKKAQNQKNQTGALKEPKEALVH